MSEESTTDVENIVELSREPVELYKILKFEGLVSSGAEAKMVIDEGLVAVNGEKEIRRRRKIRGGDIVQFEGTTLTMTFQSTD